MDRINLREKVKKLRGQGKTYAEITEILKTNIPKGTLSYWCKSIILPPFYHKKIELLNKKNGAEGRKIAIMVNRIKREKYISEVRNRVKHLPVKLKEKDTAKIALAMLFLGEGSKTNKGSLMLGNSDPEVIRLFLSLLRYCYNIVETKFRCTLQCRADQNIKKLEKFWSKITGIPLSQFYKVRIDPRTIGKPTKKPDYKGVCRIDYFSGDVFMELKQIIAVISEGPWYSGNTRLWHSRIRGSSPRGSI